MGSIAEGECRQWTVSQIPIIEQFIGVSRCIESSVVVDDARGNIPAEVDVFDGVDFRETELPVGVSAGYIGDGLNMKALNEGSQMPYPVEGTFE